MLFSDVAMLFASRCRLMFALCCLICLAPSLLQAQILDPDDIFGAGVAVDGQGLLSVRKSTDDPKALAARRAAYMKAQKMGRVAGEKGELVYISLPRVFAEAKSLLAAGKPLPDDMRYMQGMTKLRYIFVFPEEKDLVIAGDVEAYDASDRARPFGLRTARPVLRLEDFVVALRTTGPGKANNLIGCSIDLPSSAMKTVTEIMTDPDSRKLSREKKSDLLAESVGPQGVRIFGLPEDTRFAFVCVEADYILKRLAMGIDPTPVQAVRAVHQKEKLEYNRLWFMPSYEPLLVSKDGLSFEIRGQSLKLDSSGDQNAKTDATPGTQGYAKQFTKFFPQMAAEIPAFADLWNLTDLALLSALIGQDRLHDKAGWDLKWLINGNQFPVEKVEPVRSADTMANYRHGVYVIGGVMLNMGDSVSPRNREKDEAGKLEGLEARPEGADWKK